MGEHCSAQDHQTLSGSGYGIWCYHNSTSSPVDIDISIDGVDNARMASLVFTNGTSSDLSSLPDVGDLAIQNIILKILNQLTMIIAMKFSMMFMFIAIKNTHAVNYGLLSVIKDNSRKCEELSKRG